MPATSAQALLTAPGDGFDAKAWINLALTEASEGAAADEPADMRLSVLLTRLQMQATDVDASIHDTAVQIAAVAPQMVRDIASVKEQVGAVRGDMAALMEEVSSVEASSEASVALLREVLAVKQRMASVAEMLRQAERVSKLMMSAEAAFARGDSSTAADGVAELGGCLEALGAGRRQALFPDAEGRLHGLQTQLQQRLEPALMQAIGARDADATRGLVKQFGALGAGERAEACYVQCRQGPIFETWNRGSHAEGAAAGGALRSFWSYVREGATTEREWACSVFGASSGVALASGVYAEALGVLQQPMEQSIGALLPSSETGDAEAEARVALLGEAWEGALAAASALGTALAPAPADDEAGAAAAASPAAADVARAQQALLQPFEAQQRRIGATLQPRLLRKLPAVRSLAEELKHAEASLPEALTGAASGVERGGAEAVELAQAAIKRCLSLGGALSADGLLALLPRLFDGYAEPLLTLLAEARGAAKASDDFKAAPDAVGRGCLALLRAVHALRGRVGTLHGALRSSLRREARAQLPSGGSAASASAIRTEAQREAATRLLALLDGDGDGGAGAGAVAPLAARMAQLLLEAQRLALDALTQPIARGLAAVGDDKALRDVWRGAGGAGGAGAHLSPEQEADEEEVRAALLAFTPSPQDYVTRLGEQLLALPQQLEPHAAAGSDTLTLLHPSLRPPDGNAAGGGAAASPSSSPAAEEGAIGWLHAVAHVTVSRLFDAVGKIAAFSPLGAKQLAADVSYLSNILSGGLGLPPLAPLAQLELLLTCPPAEIADAVRKSDALPASLAIAVAGKRGVQLG